MIRAIKDRVIVEVDGDSNENVIKGTVVSCGSDVEDVETGYEVIFGKYVGQDYTDPEDDKEYIILIENEILAIYE